jgi:hypothetical protein
VRPVKLGKNCTLACAITAVLVTTADKPAQAKVASRANFLSFMELSPSIVFKKINGPII